MRLVLTDAARVYAQPRRRAWFFGGLLLGAVGTALLGWVAVHRAFHRQLRLSRLKSNFVSSVFHELRAPVAAARLLAESLVRGTDWLPVGAAGCAPKKTGGGAGPARPEGGRAPQSRIQAEKSSAVLSLCDVGERAAG